jgi:transcriptional regulator with XRE-family HTH domain
VDAAEFQRWIRAELKARGLTQEAAARQIGVSVKTIQRWARGKSLPRYVEFAKIGRAWKASPFK